MNSLEPKIGFPSNVDVVTNKSTLTTPLHNNFPIILLFDSPFFPNNRSISKQKKQPKKSPRLSFSSEKVVGGPGQALLLFQHFLNTNDLDNVLIDQLRQIFSHIFPFLQYLADIRGTHGGNW